MKKKSILLIAFISINVLFAQSNKLWEKQSNINSSEVKVNHRNLAQTKIYTLDIDNLKQIIQNSPQRETNPTASNIIVSFPTAEGNVERFTIFEASTMHPDLQARYPNIRSYVGLGIEDSSAVIRFSVSPLGFSAMILSSNTEATFIEPYTEDLSSYIVYNRSERINYNDDFECSVVDNVNNALSGNSNFQRNADDSILRTYRLAASATGDYTNFHGGTKALALAAINTSLTRINGIFETDFNVRMVLIANTDDVIYTNSGSDPYGNTTANYNSELQSTLTSVIGEANYDIGHLFANLQNNGNAGCIGCVCVNNQKGSGWTSHTNPIGDFFDVDYVAHEMGHQFGANHTWTHGGNEGTNAQMEPGSGSTIMSYAGITGPTTDVQANVDPYFHAKSIEQVTAYIKSTSCQTNTNTGNAVPVVNAGLNYTIPKGTAFVLDGSATDANPGDVLTYCWEQYDENNAVTTLPSTTSNSGVAFRSFNPTTDTKRYFPRLSTIKTGATSWTWEAVPNVARALNFRLTVRDNRVGGGTNNSDDMLITVNGTAGPFLVNSPNTNLTWSANSTQTVTWNVAGTTGNGINAANVDIFLSTDGGDTYPITLATGVTNDGSHNIIVPNNQGNQNRIMVRGSNNIFFDISNANFTISAPITCNVAVLTELSTSNVNSNSATLNWEVVPGATYDVRYREVGTTPYTEITNITTNSYIISGLTELTDYEAQVRSRCTSVLSAYSSNLLFSTVAIPPCTGTLINTFPYTETFDSGIGDWTQGTGDDGDWTLDANGTPSSNTGPSDDITGGGNYFYTEASTVNTGDLGSNATVYLISPCYDLTSASNPFLSFSYHMFGSNMGSLSLEISDNNGASWTNLFSLSGDQGDQWNSLSIDISSYVGQTVKLRFTGLTGNGFRSDIAIDQIMIGAPLYCASNGNSTVDEFIGRVQLNTIDNSSGAGTTSTGYSDFTAISTDLNVGNNYNITITPTWTGTIYDEAYTVWIDYNKDGDFEDANEEVFSQAPIQTTPIIGNFTIPVDASFGNTRMRVTLKYNALPTSSCESFDFGEVEDYTINLTYDGLLYTNNVWIPNAPDNTTSADNALVLDGTYNIVSDINLNNLTVNPSATVEIDMSSSLSLVGNLVSNGTLALNSDSDEYSSLIIDGSSAGNVLYRRHVNNTAAVGEDDANDLIAPPLSGETFINFISNNPNIVSNNTSTLFLFGPFDKVTNTYLLYSNVESATLDAGTGYRAASTDDITFTFFGTVNTGNINVPIVVSGPNFPEWNLIGNPYPSYIRLDDFLAANSSQLATPSVGVYGYDGNASDGWTIWNQAYSDLNPNAIITPGQGFLVASKSGGGTISFTPSMQIIGSDDDFILGRNANSGNISYLKLEINTSSLIHKTEFYFSDNASLGLDPGYDAGSFGGVAPSFGIYSHLVQDSDGRDMAIQAVNNNDINTTTIIPLGINANQGEQLTISIANSTLLQDVNVYLEDNLTNTFTLLNDSDYTFTPNVELSGTGRFFLRFEPETLSITENPINGLQIYNTNNPKLLFINGRLNKKTSLSLYDIQGRLVLSKALDINLTSNKVNLNNIASGIYIVKLKNNTQSISQKIVIH